MSASDVSGKVQNGNLLVHVAENGKSYDLSCNECSLVENVQQTLESVCGIPSNDQLLLCGDVKLESRSPLSTYKLPSDDREVFLFNKSRMRTNAPSPPPEQVDLVGIPNSPLPSQSHDPHPLDNASDPALKALPSYERQFRDHFHCGNAIYVLSQVKFEACERLLKAQKVQERATGIARGNLDHFYGMILHNYGEFLKCYTQQHRAHSDLITNFRRDVERLRSCKIHPALETANRKCLLDFVKEENLHKLVEDCNGSHQQFENKVLEFKQEFGELERHAEQLLSSKASVITGDLEQAIREHQKYVNEQKSIMQALSKDVNMVKKLVDDCLTGQLSSSLRPHDAVSALGPMYESHEKSYLPKMQSCDRAITGLLDFCKDKKNEMNVFVHNYMQKIAYIQFMIKDIRCKFSVFQEALKRQSDLFENLKVVRGIGPAYRACLAEVVRRKASMKLYMGMAGQLAERLAAKREIEVSRREEFFRVHSSYIPRDVLLSMGLFDTPSQCDVNISPFDTKLVDIDISELDHYAPEHLLGLSYRREVDDGGFELPNNNDSVEFLDIVGTSKMEVENAKLRAELASKIALICSISPEVCYESFNDEGKIDSLLKDVREKTSEAIRLKEEYEKHLKSMLKVKETQCESYEKRIQELEQRLSDHYVQSHKDSLGEGVSNLTVSCTSSSLDSKTGIISKQGKTQETLLLYDNNMSDSSSTFNPQLDSSMVDPHRDEDQDHFSDKAVKETVSVNHSSSMDLSVSRPVSALLPSEAAVGLDFNSKLSGDLVVEFEHALAEKSSQLNEAENELKRLREEVTKLSGELEKKRQLLDESQMNCAHLENCLHEAREEAQTHLCAADRRALEYGALRASAVKMRSLFERLRACVLSGGTAGLAESLRALSLSLANSVNEKEEDSTAELRECVRVLAEKVGVLSRNRSELLEQCSNAEAANKQLLKECEEKKELVNTLYKKHQLEKQANKEKISFARLEVHEIAAFVLKPEGGYYEAINRHCPHYYLSAESVALFTNHLPTHPSYIVGQVVHIERQTIRQSTQTGRVNSGPTSTPYNLPVGCEYFIVTVAMLPDTTAIHSQPPS
ncbi:unnamed protein product [Cuscuta epithymum]|uniref:Autophagy-related protein 11 n=1 Tax=Cuscuta epithymum TaxID=186058 RepID=A0AAV0D1Z6_9ASTE|nr:unnamed protein product [Cuscuta epithymum]